MHRNAILRRTGFLEGTHLKGSIAGGARSPASCSALNIIFGEVLGCRLSLCQVCDPDRRSTS